MDQAKKRLWIRAPLTKEEEAGGQRYYSEANIEGILQTFKPRSDLDRDEFVRRLEDAAWRFVNLAAAEKAKPPSTLQRDWDRRAKKIEGLLSDFGQMSGWERGDLEYAAEQLAQRTGELPDLEPGRVDLPPVPGVEPSPSDYMMVWPVTEQIEKTLTALRWLRECVTEAAMWAKYQKADSGILTHALESVAQRLQGLGAIRPRENADLTTYKLQQGAVDVSKVGDAIPALGFSAAGTMLNRPLQRV